MGDSDCCVPLPPRFVSFAWRYLEAGVSFAPRASHSARHAQPGSFHSGPPTALPEETRSPPRFLALPRPRAPLFGPGEPAAPKAIRVLRCGLPEERFVGAHYMTFRDSITRPTNSLSTLHVVRRRTPRKTRFRLAACLGRAGLVPAGRIQEVSSLCFDSLVHRLLLLQAWPGAPLLVTFVSK